MKKRTLTSIPFLSHRRILVYLAISPIILLFAWFANFCAEVNSIYANVDTNWVLAMNPERLGFEELDWTVVGFDGLRYRQSSDNPWLDKPYPGYQSPAGPDVMPLSIGQEMQARFTTRTQI